MSKSRSPEPLNENIRKTMMANKSKNTAPELEIRRILREMGHSGYRLNWKNAPGKPDIAYPGRKIAIFVNGCFWHRCPYCNLPLPKTHMEYWKPKFQKNVERDRRNIDGLLAANWTVLVIWECEIKKKPKEVRNRLENLFR